MTGKNYSEKYEILRRFIAEKGAGGVVVAFSGGVDSSTLAAVCYDVLGDKVVAVTAESPTYLSAELEDAKRVAREIGVKHHIIKTDEFSQQDFVQNPENRCFYCKTELLSSSLSYAHEIGFTTVFEGTNFSDLGGHRPGFEAVKDEKNVFSPWVEAGFTKDEIRALAKSMGLSVHDKPSLACLASRIPFGEDITMEKLARVGSAEQFIKNAFGIRQIRVRDHDGMARVEVGKDERHLLFDVGALDAVVEELKSLGFNFVTFDMEGYRTGSMLVTAESYGN